jgi:hypothetical protein
MTRRDKCYLTGIRAAKLTPPQAACAWETLARRLESMGDMDVPKFRDLLGGIRAATIFGKQLSADYKLIKS